jgi:chemotaxis signal transduction protein
MAEAKCSYLVVGAEDEEFGLDVRRVQTVVEYREPTIIPGRPGPFTGALNHHGDLLPVVPLTALLGVVPRFAPSHAFIVVLSWEDALLGVLVERAQGLLTPMERTRLVHVLGRWDGPHLLYTLETDGRRVHVLDVDALLAELAQRL